MVSIDPFYFFENSPYTRMLLEHTKGEGFRVIKANDAFYDDFAISKRKKKILLSELEGVEDPERIYRSLLRCLESGQAFHMEIRKTSREGGRFYTFAANLINFENKRLINVMTLPDPLHYSVLKQERDDAQILFNSIFQTSDSGIVVIDHNRRIVRVNNPFLQRFRWRIQDIIGKDFTIIFPDSAAKKALHNHELSLKGESSETWETALNTGDGVQADVLATSAMMEMSQKRRFHMMTFIDISDRIQIERNLIVAKEDADQANKAKSDFLANMSHELRTPLNAIIGFSEMMMNNIYGPLGNERYQEYLEDINTSAHHLLSIINDVLDMSKIEAGRLDLDDSLISPTEMARAMIRIMESRTLKEKQQIILKSEENVPRIRADERLLRQILMNLLSNAVKFTPAGKNIYVHVVFCEEQSKVCIKVQDEGIGIPEDQVNAVMEPFGQVSDPHQNKGQGTGLGLPLARAMMELHGGTLTIESKQGVGTTVTCCFPEDRKVNE